MVWRYREKAGLLPGSIRQTRWLTGLLFTVLTFFGVRFTGRQMRAEIVGDGVLREEKAAPEKPRPDAGRGAESLTKKEFI